ncbi:hypothetical protein [Pseudomonas koreensis]|uniref:hypothetical protein n=1 Tax=Pseudomonas koreensis TaxID=198620 RepID=UPI003F86620A
MRTALHNGFSKVSLLCRALKIPCSKDALELLTEQSPLFSLLKKESPSVATLLSRNMYAMENNKSSYWSIDDTILHRPKFARNFRYCPLCIQDEITTIFEDIKDLEICPIHEIYTIVKCPKCGQTEWWPEANMLNCKCGFDRKQSDQIKAKLFDENLLEVFGEKSYINRLSAIIETIRVCDEIWESRKLIDDKSLHLSERIINHADNMLRNQVKSFPGFTQRMLLAPWMTSHTLLKKHALNILSEYDNNQKKCITHDCCSGVKLSKQQIHYALGTRRLLPEYYNIFFEKDLKQKCQYSIPCQPICKRIKFVTSQKKIRKHESELLLTKSYTTRKTKVLIRCDDNTLNTLISLGYLNTNQYEHDTKSNITTMISKKSVIEFNKSYITLQEISETLHTTPSKAANSLTSLNIIPEKNNSRAKLYNRNKFNDNLSALQLHLTNLNPTLPQVYITNSATIPLRQAARILQISVAILNRRFIRPRLIEPLTQNKDLLLSNSQISAIRAHLEKNITVEQAARLLDCGRKKTLKLIIKYGVKASYRLPTTNGSWQLLYNKKDISDILHSKSMQRRNQEKLQKIRLN